MKLHFIRLVHLLSIILFVSISSVLLWHYFSKSALTLSGPRIISRSPDSNPTKDNDEAAARKPHKVEEKPANKNDEAAARKPHKVKEKPANKKNATRKNAIFDKLLARYSTSWEKQTDTFKKYRSMLGITCNAISNAVITQSNSPVGTNISYDGQKKKQKLVTPDLFSVFPKESPFQKAPYDTCAIVGNGGILANSSCGKQIDSATFVIRCNLPPLTGAYKLDTGQKTNLVTANPSILIEKYQSLNERRQSFVEDVQVYKDALLLLPAFSYWQNTAVSLRALYSLEDFNKSCPRPIFHNPTYLNNLATFWRGQGIRAKRLSTGIMMVSLALELCNNIHLYGFWPFGTHPYTHQKLTNHYYDNRPANNRVHTMPAEFESLLNLHNKGVIHLHLGECAN